MSEEPRIHRRQRPAPRPAEPPATNQNISDRPDAAAQEQAAATPIVRARTRPAPPAEDHPPVPPAVPSPSNSERQSGAPDDVTPCGSARRRRRKDYSVGWKKPPKEHQFKPGNNANPNGRPKGSKNIATKAAEALDEKVTVLRHGKPHKMAKRDIIIERLVNKVLETLDPRLLKTLLDMFPPGAVSAPETAPDPREEASNEAILKFVQAMLRDGGSLLPPASEPSIEDDDEGEPA